MSVEPCTLDSPRRALTPPPRLRRVASVVLGQESEDAIGVVQARRLLDDRNFLLHVLLDAGGVLLLDRDLLLLGLVLPGCGGVAPLLSVVTGEEPVQMCRALEVGVA